MLVIREVRKRVSWKMISQLNYLFISPIFEKGSTSPSPQKFLNIRCFRSTDNPKVEVPELTTRTPISPAVNKILRVARTDGQAVLFLFPSKPDGQAVNVEQISKNSSCFLQSLQSKVDNDQNVKKSIDLVLQSCRF